MLFAPAIAIIVKFRTYNRTAHGFADTGKVRVDYAGDISPRDAWALLSENPKAVLIDVRTTAEWAYVGVPVLSGSGGPMRKGLHQEWQTFPTMQVDPNFVAVLSQTLAQEGLGAEDPLLFLCRSGVRSLHAARAMTMKGYNRCWNIAGGFEGDPDHEGHRGTVNGWKADGLPWRQG